MIAKCGCRTIKVNDPMFARGICARCGQMFKPVPHPTQRDVLK